MNLGARGGLLVFFVVVVYFSVFPSSTAVSLCQSTKVDDSHSFEDQTGKKTNTVSILL